MKLPYRPENVVELVSPYGYRVDPITGAAGSWHAGIDLVSRGDKTICAVDSGTVIRSRIVTDPNDRTSEWGNYVCIQTPDGKFCYYCHMERRYVTAGSWVNAGDPIGLEGSTGRSTGSHCHFEVRMSDNVTTVNAAEYLGIANEPSWIAGITDPEPAAETQQDAAAVQQDNVPDAYAADAIRWAQENGILKGGTAGNLKLHEPVTRQDALVFLHRAFAAAEAYYESAD